MSLMKSNLSSRVNDLAAISKKLYEIHFKAVSSPSLVDIKVKALLEIHKKYQMKAE